MLNGFSTTEGKLEKTEINKKNRDSIVWIDLVNPTKEEEKFVEKMFHIEAPTKEEMQEIEISSRLYQEKEVLYMTSMIVTHLDEVNHENQAVTFILSPKTLITIRHGRPRSFTIFMNRMTRNCSSYPHAIDVFFGIMDIVIDRLADLVEHIGNEVDNISSEVFQKDAEKDKEKIKNSNKSLELNNILKNIGHKGDLTGKARESMLSISRMLGFLSSSAPINHRQLKANFQNHIKTFSADIISLTDHASFLSTKINFLLDATLGLINIEQTAIIKIFSVAAVVFLPPTLIASIYGMNFQFMPELSLRFGYPIAIFLMLLSALFPYLYFKYKKWL